MQFHPEWQQGSVAVTIAGQTNHTIVVGAHLDSLSMDLGQKMTRFAMAPGADDNASGVVTILEALRVLLKNPDIAAGKMKNTIEFHFYAAEEAGLLGSQLLFQERLRDSIPIKAMLNQDMTGYAEPGTAGNFGLVTDHVCPRLTTFTKKVADKYTGLSSIETKCGYACSDHASATKAGFPSAFVFESPAKETNPHIHTANDTIEHVSVDHMAQHAKLVVAWVYELAFAKL